MTTIKIELTDEQLHKLEEAAALLGMAPEQLAYSSIEELLARQDEATNANSDAKLLEKIREDSSLELQTEKRYAELNAKRWAETLTSEEQRELVQLNEQIESMQVRRVKYLIELARLRKTSLTTLIDDLGIKPRSA